jgi:crossover junction endodeoxyribonuclease RusA
VSLTFYPPSKRAIDLDNCLARFKAGIDGLVDVLQVDDSRWKLTIEKADQVGGYVEVKILDKDTGQA